MRFLLALVICLGLLAVACDATDATRRRHHHKRHHWSGLKTGWHAKHYLYMSAFPCQILPNLPIVRFEGLNVEKPAANSKRPEDEGVLHRMMVGNVTVKTLDLDGVKAEASDDVGRVIFIARRRKEVAQKKGLFNFAKSDFVKEFPHRVCCSMVDQPARLVCQQTADVEKIKSGSKIKLFANQFVKDKLSMSLASIELSKVECGVGDCGGQKECGVGQKLLTWPIAENPGLSGGNGFAVQKLNPDDKANGPSRIQITVPTAFKGFSGYYTPLAGDPSSESAEVCCSVSKADQKLSCLYDEVILSLVSGTPFSVTQDAPAAADADASSSSSSRSSSDSSSSSSSSSSLTKISAK